MGHRFVETELGRAFVPTDSWSDEEERAFELSDVRALFLDQEEGWSGTHLDFLARLSRLEHLVVSSDRRLDISAVREMRGLRTLHLLVPSRPRWPVWDLPWLEDLSIRWYGGARCVFKCPVLRRLVLRDPELSDTKELETLPSLEALHLVGGRVEDFNGLRRLSDLRELVLAAYPDLRDLGFVRDLPRLRSLEVRACHGLRTLSGLDAVRNLEVLRLPENGRIDTLIPIGSLLSLEEVSFPGSTEIVDGNLRILATLPRLDRVEFTDRRHYTHRLRDFE